MNEKLSPCIFCGVDTADEHTTEIGLVFIHSECLIDLKEILSLTKDEVMEVKI